jgi:hypothetical protein
LRAALGHDQRTAPTLIADVATPTCLPPAFDGFKDPQISDLHASGFSSTDRWNGLWP